MDGLVAASAFHAQADRLPGADQTARLGDITAEKTRFCSLFIRAGLAVGFVTEKLMPFCFGIEIAAQSIAGFSDNCLGAPAPHQGGLSMA